MSATAAMRTFLFILIAPTLLTAQSARAGRNQDWPIYGGTTDNTHYSILSQITPANVATLVAWTYETRDEFKGSEMQTNPVVIDGILYGTSPKLRVFALDAATGKELWSFDPNYGRRAPSRFRHRGLVVTGDRVLVTYRYRLYALDRNTGVPIPTFGDSSGFVDMRNAHQSEHSEVSQFRLADLSRSRRLSTDQATVGDAERDRSQHRRDEMVGATWRVSGACRAGNEGHRHR
jgi:quinoprotein glucose dehydrogenase